MSSQYTGTEQTSNHTCRSYYFDFCNPVPQKISRGQTLAVIRKEFWIVNGKSVVTGSIINCLPCRRLKSDPHAQLM